MGALRAGVRELGYVEGQQIGIIDRLAEEKSHRLPDLAAELIRLKVDVILTAGLLSYAPSYTDSFKRAAVYVDKILKGAKPADLASVRMRSSNSMNGREYLLDSPPSAVAGAYRSRTSRCGGPELAVLTPAAERDR